LSKSRTFGISLFVYGVIIIGSQLIKPNEYPVAPVIDILLKDRTTGKNIIFATNEYAFAYERDEITSELVSGKFFSEMQPRVEKAKENQAARTKEKAEVFTPSWICNKMNNHCDEEWFGKKGVFNTERGNSWAVNNKKVEFPEEKTWKDYVLSKRLEITCGEAPYIVSRYDTTSGEPIEINRRIGILDRKLRVVNENAKDEKEWRDWVYKAFQSVYGYEFQGDNLLIARINLLCTFVDYMLAVQGKKPTKQQLNKIAEIVSWNIWQMDGLKGTIPFENKPDEYDGQIGFDFIFGTNEQKEEINVECVIKDWQAGKKVKFSDIRSNKDEI
jgi:hypothetical protein